MNKKYRYQVTRRSITCETYWVEADSPEEVMEMCSNGETGDPDLEFIDWYDDEYEIEGREIIDPLYKMVKDYECDTTS
jgi:hypothetical protein